MYFLVFDKLMIIDRPIVQIKLDHKHIDIPVCIIAIGFALVSLLLFA
jgi:hypothetical protein